MTENKTLLPSGFADTLPPNAAHETQLATGLLHHFASWGYTQVKPPMVEFFDSLSAGKGETLNTQIFRVTDPASSQTMGIRADMTPQIARMAAERFTPESFPLRLSYSGQVLRMSGEGLYQERQLAQAGVELIGEDMASADAEVIHLAVEALEQLGLKDISVDFSMPQLVPCLLKNEANSALFDAIEKKDIAAISAHPDGQLLVDLINTAGPAQNALETIKALSLSEEAQACVAQLASIIAQLEGITLTIDPLERRGFEYHTGASFALFSPQSQEELGRGGRYVIADTIPAVGFTLNVNALARTIPASENNDTVYIPFGAAKEEGVRLRAQGYRTIHGLAETDTAEDAKQLGCTHIYKEGEITLI